jgi:hypothetical protein
MRGPLVYCFEQADNTVDVRDIRIAPDTEFRASFDPDCLGGAIVLRGEVETAGDPAWDGRLYREASETTDIASSRKSAIAIPYYAWANRAPGPMTVWALRG